LSSYVGPTGCTPSERTTVEWQLVDVSDNPNVNVRTHLMRFLLFDTCTTTNLDAVAANASEAFVATRPVRTGIITLDVLK
jgi:hypothetical protein